MIEAFELWSWVMSGLFIESSIRQVNEILSSCWIVRFYKTLFLAILTLTNSFACVSLHASATFQPYFDWLNLFSYTTIGIVLLVIFSSILIPSQESAYTTISPLYLYKIDILTVVIVSLNILSDRFVLT